MSRRRQLGASYYQSAASSAMVVVMSILLKLLWCVVAGIIIYVLAAGICILISFMGHSTMVKIGGTSRDLQDLIFYIGCIPAFIYIFITVKSR